MLKPESSLHLHWRSPFPEVKNGGLNFVLGGERDGTHWFGGDVIKEVGICSFFSKTERSFIWKKLLTRLMQFFSTWISFKNHSWTHQIIIILRLVSGHWFAWQVGVGGVFGEDYLRIDASHTLEASRCRRCIFELQVYIFYKIDPPLLKRWELYRWSKTIM